MITFYYILRDVCKPLLGRGWGGLLFFCTMMLTSCVNDLPYDAEIGAPKLVLNALLQPDSILTARVSRTVHFLDNEDAPRLSDAIVTATINGEEHALAYDAATQQYRCDYRLQAGDEVTLTATHAIGTATATQRVACPTPIHITHVATQPFTNPGDPVSLATLNDVDSAMLVSLYIDDPIEEANYYRLTVDYEGRYEVNWDEEGYMASPNLSQGEELDSAIAESPNCPSVYSERSLQRVASMASRAERGEHSALCDGVWTSPKGGGSCLWPLRAANVVSKRSAEQSPRGRGEAFYPHYLLTESSMRLILESETASQLIGSLLYMTSSNSIVFSDEQLRDKEGRPVIDLLMLLESPRSASNGMNNPESGWGGDDIWEEDNYIFPADTVSQATYHYSFTLETFSEDYYHYMQSVSSYEIMGGAFVGEATPIHSNIRGGLGIVGSYSLAPMAYGERRATLPTPAM